MRKAKLLLTVLQGLDRTPVEILFASRPKAVQLRRAALILQIGQRSRNLPSALRNMVQATSIAAPRSKSGITEANRADHRFGLMTESSPAVSTSVPSLRSHIPVSRNQTRHAFLRSLHNDPTRKLTYFDYKLRIPTALQAGGNQANACAIT